MILELQIQSYKKHLESGRPPDPEGDDDNQEIDVDDDELEKKELELKMKEVSYICFVCSHI